MGLICERCGHEHVESVKGWRTATLPFEECIANLRADLAEARALIRRVVAELDPPMGAGRCITGPTIAALRAFRDREP